MLARLELPAAIILAFLAATLPYLMPYLVVTQLLFHVAALIMTQPTIEQRTFGILIALMAVVTLVNMVITPFPNTTMPQTLRLLSSLGLFYASLRLSQTVPILNIRVAMLGLLAIVSAAASQISIQSVDLAVFAAPVLFIPLSVFVLFAPASVRLPLFVRALHGAAIVLGLFSMVWLPWDGVILLTIAIGVVMAAGIQLVSRMQKTLPVLLFLSAMFLFFPFAPHSLTNFISSLWLDTQLEKQHEIWERARFIIHSFPLTGIGMGGIGPIMEVLYPPTLSVRVQDAGHLLLQVGTDFGIPGTLILITLWLRSTLILLRNMRDAPASSVENWMAIGAIVMQIPIFLLASSRVVFWGNAPAAPFLWLILGSAVRLSSFNHMRTQHSQGGIE